MAVLGRLLAIWLVALAAPVSAETASAAFSVHGKRLLFDTTHAPQGITGQHATTLSLLIGAQPDITVIELSSQGGDVSAAWDMAAQIEQARLDTHVTRECVSACTLLFLAGRKRTMSFDGHLGFHQTARTPDGLAQLYFENQDIMDWSNPFEMASWLQERVQTDVHATLIYMMRRGVDPLFAIQTIGVPHDNMWYPWRARLLAAGVLTD